MYAVFSTSQDLYEEGLDAWQDEDNELAATLWLSAADTASAENAEKIADGLSAIAIDYLRAFKFDEETEEILERALELRYAYPGGDDLAIAVELNNIGTLHRNWNDDEKAIEFFERSVAILDNHPNLESENFADPYDHLAIVLYEKGDLSRAATVCLQALDIRDRILKKLNPFSLKSLELLANIQEAIKAYSRSARETRKEYDARLSSLAATSYQLGDPFLVDTLAVASKLGGKEGRDLISESVTILCQEFLRIKRMS